MPRRKESSYKKIMKKIRKKKVLGFTLIELLAVIIILGVLMIIAIPSVTEYISSSRKNAYITTAGQYISGARNKINSAEIPMYDVDTTYYLSASCISLEKGGNSPFGEWQEAYVVVTYDGFGYDYYWTSRDSANMGIYLTYENLLDDESVKTGVESLDTAIGIGSRSKIIKVNESCSVETAETYVATSSIDERTEWIPSYVDVIPLPELNYMVHANLKGLDMYSGYYVWNANGKTYYSESSKQYVLDGTQWKPQTWNISNLDANLVWSDGKDTYYSTTHKLNGDVWEEYSFNGPLTVIRRECIWTDGKNTYYSAWKKQYVLNGNTWVEKTWNLESYYAQYLYSNGKDIYYSDGSQHYKLNNGNWMPMTFQGLTTFWGNKVWSDGYNFYYSDWSNQYVLRGNTWEKINWTGGYTQFYKSDLWTDGTNFYYSESGRSTYKFITK